MRQDTATGEFGPYFSCNSTNCKQFTDRATGTLRHLDIYIRTYIHTYVHTNVQRN